jgi:hypothetical protein
MVSGVFALLGAVGKNVVLLIEILKLCSRLTTKNELQSKIADHPPSGPPSPIPHPSHACAAAIWPTMASSGCCCHCCCDCSADWRAVRPPFCQTARPPGPGPGMHSRQIRGHRGWSQALGGPQNAGHRPHHSSHLLICFNGED